MPEEYSCVVLFAVGLWNHRTGPRAVLLPEALAVVDKPAVKTLPIPQAFDSTIDLKGIFIVLRTGNFFFFFFFKLSADNLTQHFPCILVLGKSHGCPSIFSELLLIFKTLTVFACCVFPPSSSPQAEVLFAIVLFTLL